MYPIEARTESQTYRRRLSLIICLEKKPFVFWLPFYCSLFQRIKLIISIGSGCGLGPNRCQAIICTQDYPIHWGWLWNGLAVTSEVNSLAPVGCDCNYKITLFELEPYFSRTNELIFNPMLLVKCHKFVDEYCILFLNKWNQSYNVSG